MYLVRTQFTAKWTKEIPERLEAIQLIKESSKEAAERKAEKMIKAATPDAELGRTQSTDLFVEEGVCTLYVGEQIKEKGTWTCD